MKSAKSLSRPTHLVCLVCNKEFEVPPPKNYEYDKVRSTCSDACMGILCNQKKAKNAQVHRDRQAKLKARTPRADRNNVYRMVHEKALAFAGVKKHESDNDLE